jgi:hypothetical protein
MICARAILEMKVQVICRLLNDPTEAAENGGFFSSFPA